MSKKESFVVNRLKSIGYAFKGALCLIKTEASIKIQLFVAIVATFAGLHFNISSEEWLAQIICIGMVLGIEGVNTAIEHLSDFVHPNHHKSIGRIKDISAGAVFIAATTAVIVGLVIYAPKLF